MTDLLILLASCKQTCVTCTIAVCTVKKTPDDRQRNCPKHVGVYSKNKFEKLVHLVGFIIRTFYFVRALNPRRIFPTSVIAATFDFRNRISTTRRVCDFFVLEQPNIKINAILCGRFVSHEPQH